MRLRFKKPKTTLTNDEVKELALGIMSGAIFTDRSLGEHNNHMLGSVFMPFLFMDDDLRKQTMKTLLPKGEKSKKMGMIYEFMDKAGPRSVNGLPIFHTMHVIGPDDVSRVGAVMEAVVKVKVK